MSKTLADYPQLLAEWHPTKNGDAKPEAISYGSTLKIWWMCEKGHEWEAVCYSRTTGKNCPFCANQKVCNDNCLTTMFPEIAKEWHPTKNNVYPHEILGGSCQKYWWICEKGHEWSASLNSRTSGRNCPFCANRKVCIDNCLVVTHPTLAKEWHPTKNGILTPDKIIAGTHKKYWWICEKGHEWLANCKNRSNGYNCPYCTNQKPYPDNCLATLFPDVAKELHPTKNGIINPENIIAGSNKEYWWICEKGHEWLTKCCKRISGRNCPICNQSKGELKIRNFLINQKLDFEQQSRFNDCRRIQQLVFDFKIMHKDVDVFLVEYNGRHHYEIVKWAGEKWTDKRASDELELVKVKDDIKKKWCEANSMPLLVIPYWEFDNIDNIIAEFISQRKSLHTAAARGVRT